MNTMCLVFWLIPQAAFNSAFTIPGWMLAGSGHLSEEGCKTVVINLEEEHPTKYKGRLFYAMVNKETAEKIRLEEAAR